MHAYVFESGAAEFNYLAQFSRLYDTIICAICLNY